MMIKANQRGTALVTTLIIASTLVGLSATYLFVSYSGYEFNARETDTVRSRLAAEEGLHRSMAELKTGLDPGGDGVGTVDYTGADGRQSLTIATALGGNLFRLHAEGEVPRSKIGCDTLIEVLPAPSLSFPLRAAIVAEGPVSTTGNINVDGRDWNESGSAIVGPGVYGISSMQTISNGGSSTVGGNGAAPASPPPAVAKESNANWADGVDQDGDSLVDEEDFDGDDDDGDGEIDEDTNDFPTTPDVMFGLPNGTLKNIAIAAGTYFSSQAQVDAYVTANGGEMPGGKIIYCDFALWLPVQLGNGLNAEPGIIIHHNATGTAVAKNVHGGFKGLFLSDFVQHINGSFFLVGGLMSFADESVGNTFGNGSADILFSSAVLGNLPASSNINRVRVLSWSRSAVN